MQCAHHYIASRARSRSPSPSHLEEDEEDVEGGQSKDFLQVETGRDEVFNGARKKRSSSQRSRTGSQRSQKINEQLVHSQPVNALITVSDSQDPTSVSDSDAPTRELIVRPQHSRSLGEMDELAGDVRNYGSITSQPGSGSVNGDAGNSQGGSHENLLSSVNSSGSERTRLKHQKSYYTPSMVDELRKRNKLFFMDPITKLLYFHGFPWKLTLQIIKVVLITVQIVIFGGQQENIVDYFERSELTYKHLLLKDWDIGHETMPYPPATGKYAIYSMNDLFDHMNTVMEQYYKMPERSLAAVHLNKDNATGMAYPIELCFRANYFQEFNNDTYIVTADVMHNCTFLHRNESEKNMSFNIREYLKEHNFTLPFNRTLDISLKFYIKTFHLNLLKTHYGPTCYNVSIKITYTNNERSGQLLVDLTSEPSEIDCNGKILSPQAQEETESMKAKVISLDVVVMVVCCLSTILCSRSLKRCNKLRKDTASYFKRQRGKPFSLSTQMEYINMWYVLIICNDILTVIGSSFKIQLETRVFTISSKNYEICSIFLGLGVFLSYIGILRYLGFFKSYNVLILTLKTSFPHVLRFLVCAICLYTGFLFCGWVVFSPYHIKFRQLSTASECLFSLVNGDDMFVTFSALRNNSNAIWYFHRAYLYIFISLFIYVVISVFIAVIMENYENLKRYYEEGFPETPIMSFIHEDGDMPLTEVFRHVQRGHKCQHWFFCIFPCLACFRKESKMTCLIEEEKQKLAATI